MLKRILPVSLTGVLLLSACASAPDVTSALSPYRVDVRQGNFVSQDMVARLKPGMTRDQVRFVLGSPLVADVFHNDRWDYIYRFQPGKGPIQQRRLIVHFESDKLTRVGGDVVAETDAAAADSASPSARIVEVPGALKKD